jgi:putative zinc finger/helix-turn-helix YgiT family protein
MSRGGETDMECLNCGAQMNKKVAPVDGAYGDKKFIVKTTAMVCPTCGYKTVDAQNLDEYYRAVADEYRASEGRLTSKELVGLRMRMKKSQREFADYLGVGEASVKRWELGKVQERAMDELIRLKTQVEYSAKNHFQVLTQSGEADEFSGWRALDLKRVKQLVAYFLNEIAKQKKKLTHEPLVLNKLLWYADCNHVRQHGESLTGLRYARIDRGPVPDDYVELYKYLDAEKVLRYASAETLIPRMPFDATVFSKSEIKTIESTWKQFKDRLEKIEELSHAEKAYKETAHAKQISFARVLKK